MDVQKDSDYGSKRIIIVEALKDNYGQEAEEVLNSIYDKYPLSDKNASLDEILGNVPIHQGIQNLIINAETRESSVITAFCEKYGDEVKELVVKSAQEHGVECGKRAAVERGSRGECSASKAFELIQSYLCDGMPCDRGAQAQSEEDNRTTWDIQNVFMNSAGRTQAHHSKLCAIC